MRYESKLKAVGKVTVEKFRQGESVPYETLTARNALTTAGKNHILERIGGITTTNPLSASAVLRIYNGVPTLVKTLTGLEAGYPQHSTGSGQATVTLRWRDGSTDTYSANELRVYFAGDSIQLNSLTPAFGTKPTNEAWVYTFTLTLAQGTSALPAAGIDHMLKLVTGVSANYLTAANTQLRVHTDAGLGTMLLDWVDANTANRSGQTLTWTWVVTAGNGTGTWGHTQVRSQADSLNVRSGTSSAGSKGALVERTYTYSVSL